MFRTSRLSELARQVLGALSLWSRRQILVAVGAAIGIAIFTGLVTVLIPNNIFARDIPPVWWNYPVWIATASFAGMLVATYVRDDVSDEREETRKSSKFGALGGVFAFFAVGCPVCNKLAILALGYSGALTWFAPVQPFLAVIGLTLTLGALIFRLRGQVMCSIPRYEMTGTQ